MHHLYILNIAVNQTLYFVRILLEKSFKNFCTAGYHRNYEKHPLAATNFYFNFSESQIRFSAKRSTVFTPSSSLAESPG